MYYYTNISPYYNQTNQAILYYAHTYQPLLYSDKSGHTCIMIQISALIILRQIRPYMYYDTNISPYYAQTNQAILYYAHKYQPLLYSDKSGQTCIIIQISALIIIRQIRPYCIMLTHISPYYTQTNQAIHVL